jgi:CheY-like chemotaxis protein
LGLETGLCLEIRLPLNPEPEKALDVLVVEDDPDSAELLALLLESVGHHPRTAHDGTQALQAVRSALPDVVFCDLGLPAPLDGCTLARILRQEPGGGEILLVALTGSGSEEDRARSRQAGFDLHLVKPTSPEQLHSILATRSPRVSR